MRTLFRGNVSLSYSQMYVECAGPPTDDPDLTAVFAGQRNGLCGAVLPGQLFLTTGLHTGTVPCTVELHGEVPPVGEQWEEVVEASFTPSALPITLMGCMANEWAAEFVLGLGLSHRVRYCATGMDAGKAADFRDAHEPEIDRYLLQFWPAPAGPDEVLRQTSACAAYWHQYARDMPSAAESARDPAAALREEDQRQRQLQENILWRGARPDGPIAAVPEVAQLVRLDRALVDALASASVDRRRAAARFAARRALTGAGLADVDWIATALVALEAGKPLPPPCDDHALAWRALYRDDRVPVGIVRPPVGTADDWSRQAMTFPALLSAANPDPLRAAVASLVHASAAVAHDQRAALLADARRILDG